MALAPFFERIYGAVGGHLAISRESLHAVLDTVSVGVCCGNKLSANDIWIAELSVNLLARLYPRLAIVGSNDECERLKKSARSINPRIEFIDASQPETTISVGLADAQAINPSAHGWVAQLGEHRSSSPGPSNPYAAGAAAAFACSELFRRVFFKRRVDTDVSVSLLDFGRSAGADLQLPATDIGEVLFVGVGAVGNGALWAFNRDAQIRGLLHLCDGESIELSNLQRYVLADTTHVGKSKVGLGRRVLSKSNLVVKEHEMSLAKYAAKRVPFDIPVIAVSVDNVAGRRASQALLPRLVVNGWTGEHALGASWHVFSEDRACLACLYHPHGQGISAIEQASRALGIPHDRAAALWVTPERLNEADVRAAATSLGVDFKVLSSWVGKRLGDLYTDVVCGAVPLDVNGLGKIETVPLAHQSALAGVLMAAELIKRLEPTLSPVSQPEPLVSWDNILQAVPTSWCKPRPREDGCICTDDVYQSIYRQKWPAPH